MKISGVFMIEAKLGDTVPELIAAARILSGTKDEDIGFFYQEDSVIIPAEHFRHLDDENITFLASEGLRESSETGGETIKLSKLSL